MKTTDIYKLPILLLGACLIAIAPPVQADPPEAEDQANLVAVQYRDRGFFVTPVDAALLMRGEMVRIQIPVVRGLDYVVITAGDAAARDVDLYVYSEVDNLIINDDLNRKNAIVQFRAQYTGSVYAYIHMAQTNAGSGLPSYAAYVGRRGTARTPAGGGTGGAGGNKVQPSTSTSGGTAPNPNAANSPVKN